MLPNNNMLTIAVSSGDFMYSVFVSLELEYMPTSASTTSVTALQWSFISGSGSQEEV